MCVRACVCACVFALTTRSSSSSSSAYLAERQAVLVLVLVFDLKVVQGLALRWGLAEGPQQQDVAGRQEAVAAVELAVVPVVVHLASQDDDVALGELQVAGLLALVGVEGLAARQRRNVLGERGGGEKRARLR